MVHIASKEWIGTRFNLPHYLEATVKQLEHYGMGGLANRLGSCFVKPKGKVYTEPDNRYHSEVFGMNDTYFDGHWFSQRYFAKITDLIHDIYWVPDGRLPETSKPLLKELTRGETVAMHVFEPQHKKSTTTPDYFNWAIANVLNALDKPRFVVFTTDLQWVNEHLDFQGADVEKINFPAEGDAGTLPYMSRAKHNILSWSLTGWWAAWLNRNPDKIVIAPEQSSHIHVYPDLLPQEWTTIPVK